MHFYIPFLFHVFFQQQPQRHYGFSDPGRAIAAVSGGTACVMDAVVDFVSRHFAVIQKVNRILAHIKEQLTHIKKRLTCNGRSVK